MKRLLSAALFVLTLSTAIPAYAQNPNYDVGPVYIRCGDVRRF